ncbi:HDOD domain-containing protein [Mariprofundus sp. NF]|uniref:HDOD domain-containing protein n=1 Tax=Mariprofundus sp. NF TaxID=2608716 RepID=UPI0015A2F755|nr:HDOD domain-containing protein [Mariprofundus sp. NF]NWF39070.1 HDOD domain-containing protein [Mariprofundus sp. NF]
MSWFGKLFGKRNSENERSERSSRTTTRKSIPTQTVQINECPPNSLGGLLSSCPSSLCNSSAYDLSKPPRLDGPILKHLRSKIHEIPPMPEIWHKIQQILEQPDASAGELGAVIAQDPILTAQILKVCNSSAYSIPGSSEISNIPLAIARLGLDETSNVIFNCLAPELGQNENMRQQVRYIWMHCQSISSLTRLLAESCQKLERHDASLIGMLHDIGKLVILNLESDEKLTQLKAAIDSGTDALQAEYEQLGYTHIDAGVILALHWQLPKKVQHFISYHHHTGSLPVSSIPRELQHAMMALNLAHLIFEHFTKGESIMASELVWSAHCCGFARINESFISDELRLPIESAAFYRQLEGEVSRIKLSFADLFQAAE